MSTSSSLPLTKTTPVEAIRTRLRVGASALVVIALLVWGFWTWTSQVSNLDRSGTPLGGDFLMFYTAGTMVQQDPLSLYDEVRQQAEFRRILPGLEPDSCRLPYRYPPVVAILMAPLSRLPFPYAFAVFAALSVALGCLTVKMFNHLEATLLGGASACFGWWMMGWPVALETILGGQQAFFGLAIATATILLLQREREVGAGMVLGLACYKPNLLLLFGFALLLRYPRMIWGVAVSATALLVLQLAVGGVACIETYGGLARQLATEPWGLETPAVKVHGLAPWLAYLRPGDERKILLALGVLGAIVWAWCDRRTQKGSGDRRTQKGSRDRRTMGDIHVRALSISWLILWNALCNPYLPIYDLLLLGLPTWLLFRIGSERGMSARVLGCFLGLMSLGPHLSQAIAAQTGVQIFPFVLLALVIAVGYSIGRKCYGVSACVAQPVGPSV